MPRSYAEHLLDVANKISRFPTTNGLVRLDGFAMEDFQLARVALAVEFSKRDPGLIFRAVFEEWDESRVTREMY